MYSNETMKNKYFKFKLFNYLPPTIMQHCSPLFYISVSAKTISCQLTTHLHACTVQLPSDLPLKGGKNFPTLPPRHVQLVPQLERSSENFLFPPKLASAILILALKMFCLRTILSKSCLHCPLLPVEGIFLAILSFLYQIKKFVKSCY